MKLINYLRVWLACARYSVVRTMMFRFDFIMWALVELFWMAVNVLLVGVIYRHTDEIAGWTMYEMLMLVGTSMIMQRLMMGLFWSNLFELGRNIRTGHFDFFLAQPGNPLFMVATRKLDLDGLMNVFVAVSVVVFAAHKLGITPTFAHLAWYGFMLGCGLMIQFGLLLIIVSLTFWVGGSQGLEGSYFTLFEFSRLPRQAFRGLANIVFVWALPVVAVSYVPTRTFLHGFDPVLAAWLVGVAAFWTLAGIFVFNLGLKRYSSASS